MNRFAVLVSLCAALLVAAAPPSVASAWAPTGQATVHPGVRVFAADAQCTVSFVFEESGAAILGS
ncbi:MAG TPA: hypothetical protein VHQ43_00805 [Solirubrobacterales bacterium]|jgi:hypothetical protein|nr:hypothetical protein [Solirubrobacterales bacterium]